LLPLGDRVTVVSAGEEFVAHGFTVRALGGQHALIHAELPVVTNLGYLVEGAVYHPGDSFSVPEAEVDTLLLPVHAPWSKVGEVLDFLISVRAPRVHQIHDGLLNERGIDIVEGHVRRVAERYGSRFTHLDSGESVDL
jgi:L-ascorbate metabolism protein UlaG (beta-lactamase superfamily)